MDHLISIRMAAIKNPENKCCWEYGEAEMLLHYWKCKMMQPLWKKSMTIPQKFSNRTAIWSSNSTSGYIYRRIKIRIVKRCLHSNICISTVHNSQEIEATQMPTNGWINNQMQSIHTEEHYLALKKERNRFICYSTDDLEDMLSKKRKISHKMTNTVWFHWNKVSRVVKFIETNSRIVVVRA